MSESIPKIHAVLAIWHWMKVYSELFAWVLLFFLHLHLHSNCYCVVLLFFLEEDRYDSYSRMILKYFLAEGVVCRHELFVSAAQDNPDDILQVWNGICCFTKSCILFWPSCQQWCQDNLKISTSTSSHCNICRRVNDIFEKAFATFHH